MVNLSQQLSIKFLKSFLATQLILVLNAKKQLRFNVDQGSSTGAIRGDLNNLKNWGAILNNWGAISQLQILL